MSAANKVASKHVRLNDGGSQGGFLPVVVFSHVHTPRYRVFSRVKNGKIIKMAGWIIPSWQKKTRFGNSVAAMQMNSIGMGYSEITKNGDIVKPDFEIL